jgi:hypothetical protein
MKKILIVLLIVISTKSFGQTIAIASSKNNVLYFGIENPLDVVVENMKCGSFILTTDNGTLTGEKCKYLIKPEEYSLVNIYIMKIIRNDSMFIGKKVFRVEKVPLPIASIGGVKLGKINKNKLIVSGGIVAKLYYVDIDAFFKINEYSVIIFRDKTPFYKTQVQGNRFTEEMINEFKKLQSNDELIFYNIRISEPSIDWTDERLEPINLTIE